MRLVRKIKLSRYMQLIKRETKPNLRQKRLPAILNWFFIVDKKFKTGKYAFQIRPAKASAFLCSTEIFAPERANAQFEDDTEKSDAVLADIVEDTEIPQPCNTKGRGY